MILCIRTRSAKIFLAPLYKNSMRAIARFLKNFLGDFMYFKRVYRLFWQSFSQILPPPWPLPQRSRGGGTGASSSPLYPRLKVSLLKVLTCDQWQLNVSSYIIQSTLKWDTTNFTYMTLLGIFRSVLFLFNLGPTKNAIFIKLSVSPFNSTGWPVIYSCVFLVYLVKRNLSSVRYCTVT